MNPDDFTLTSECPKCGMEHDPDEDGWAKCYGNPDDGLHGGIVVWRPCAICGSYITWGELCSDCAEDNDPFPRIDPMHAQPVRRVK